MRRPAARDHGIGAQCSSTTRLSAPSNGCTRRSAKTTSARRPQSRSLDAAVSKCFGLTRDRGPRTFANRDGRTPPAPMPAPSTLWSEHRPPAGRRPVESTRSPPMLHTALVRKALARVFITGCGTEVGRARQSQYTSGRMPCCSARSLRTTSQFNSARRRERRPGSDSGCDHALAQRSRRLCSKGRKINSSLRPQESVAAKLFNGLPNIRQQRVLGNTETSTQGVGDVRHRRVLHERSHGVRRSLASTATLVSGTYTSSSPRPSHSSVSAMRHSRASSDRRSSPIIEGSRRAFQAAHGSYDMQRRSEASRRATESKSRR